MTYVTIQIYMTITTVKIRTFHPPGGNSLLISSCQFSLAPKLPSPTSTFCLHEFIHPEKLTWAESQSAAFCDCFFHWACYLQDTSMHCYFLIFHVELRFHCIYISHMVLPILPQMGICCFPCGETKKLLIALLWTIPVPKFTWTNKGVVACNILFFIWFWSCLVALCGYSLLRDSFWQCSVDHNVMPEI